MAENDVDTVTPVDDGDFTPFDDHGNITPEHYETRGQTTVATRRGYAFVPSDKNVPVITAEGVQVTKDQADAIVNESNGRVHIVEDQED